MSWHIRRATPADAQQLAFLRFQFRSSLADAVEPQAAFVGRAATWYESALAGGHWHGWVAQSSDIVAHGFMQRIEKIPNPVAEAEWIGYVTNIFVLPDWRRRGIATAIVAAICAFCRDVGAYSMILWPTPESLTLYRAHGFAISPDVFWESYAHN
jgi:GNAT superfamily N-acetyltransferase